MSRLHNRGALAAAVAVIAIALAGCEVIPHPTFDVVEPPDGAVTVLALSGDGNFVVVSATGPGNTVPGAGLWRVDRRDGTTAALPANATLVAISNDGQRLELNISSVGFRIWDEGVVITPPPSAHFNKDLTWAVYQAVFGTGLRRWETATRATTLPETGFPRPAAEPNTDGTWGISLDGNTVWFKLTGSGPCITRFIDLAAQRVDDEPACNVTVSANGASYLIETDQFAQHTGDGDFGGPARIDLVNRAHRQSVATLTAEHQYLADIAIADTGSVFWAIDTAVSGTFPGDGCGAPLLPPCTGSVDSVTALAVTTSARQRFSVEAGESSVSLPDLPEPRRSSINADGRFLTYVGSGPTHPLHVLDRYFVKDEVLTGHGTMASSDSNDCTKIGQTAPCTLPVPPGPPFISADGRVIVAPGDRGPYGFSDSAGWYEFLAAS